MSQRAARGISTLFGAVRCRVTLRLPSWRVQYSGLAAARRRQSSKLGMTRSPAEDAKATLLGLRSDAVPSAVPSARAFWGEEHVAPRPTSTAVAQPGGAAALLDALSVGRPVVAEAPAGAGPAAARGVVVGVPARPRPAPSAEVCLPPPTPPVNIPLRLAVTPVAVDGADGATLAVSAPECILQPQWAGSHVRLCPNPLCPRNEETGPLLRLSPFRRSGAAVQFCDAAPTAAAVPTAASSLGRLGLAPLLAERAAAEEAAEAAAAAARALSPRPSMRSPRARARSAAPPTAPRAPPASPVVSPPRSPRPAAAAAPVTPPLLPIPAPARAAAPAPPAAMRMERGFVSETELFGGFDDDVWAPTADGAVPQPEAAPPASVAWTESSAESLSSLAISEPDAEAAQPRGKLIRRDSDYDASDDLDGDSVDAWGARARAMQQAAAQAPVAADGTVRVADLVAATRRSAQAMAEDDDYAEWHDTV